MREILISLCALTLVCLGVNGQTYFLNGTAEFIGDDCYQLTEELPAQNGAVWYADQINLDEEFEIEFLMNFGTIDGNGADGIMFVLQDVGTSALGISGGGLGFAGFEPSLGIEFDTWHNGEYSDIVSDHVGIVSNGDVDHSSINSITLPVSADINSANIEDGQDHVVKISWNPDIQEINVWFDCNLRITSTHDIKNNIFNGENSVWWGFTSSTGGAWNFQTVCLQENILSVGPNATICNGSSTVLGIGGNPDGNYTWMPETGLDDPQSSNPIASPTETTTYAVIYDDFCGNELYDSITVSVEELNVELFFDGILNCYTPTLEIDTDINFSNGINYNWNTPDGNIVGSTNNPNITVDQAGSYTLEVDYNDECFDSETFEIEADFETYVAEAGEDIELNCYNPILNLSGETDNSNANISWTSNNGNILNGENTLTPSVDDAGSYTITITNLDNGCESEDIVTVNENFAIPLVEAGLIDTLSCEQPQLEIQEVNTNADNYSAEWTSNTGTIVSGWNSLQTIVGAGGVYYLTITDLENGCSSSDSVTFIMDDNVNVDFFDIVFPNVFTPNRDGYNENLKPFIKQFPELDLETYLNTYTLEIYNRWGNKIFESSESNFGWDGTIDEKLMETGTYYYIFKYEITCGSQISNTLSGTCQLLFD